MGAGIVDFEDEAAGGFIHRRQSAMDRWKFQFVVGYFLFIHRSQSVGLWAPVAAIGVRRRAETQTRN